MKQKALKDVVVAFDDKARSIKDRLLVLGLGAKALENLFSADLLSMQVYGSSFLKFLQENAGKLDYDGKIPAEPLPTDFKNPFEEGSMSVGDRLGELGLVNLDSLFSGDVLNVKVNGDEFQTFVSSNQSKFIGEMERLAGLGGQNG